MPRRNYDIRTQCLKGTCSSSELPGRWHVSLFLDAACPCRGCSSMFSPEASTWKGRLRVPLLDQIHCFGFPDRADDGVRTRGFLLGKQACYHCTTSAWPCFFRIRRTAVTYSPPAERGMAGLRVGLTGFEPATPCSQSTCATKLRHNPLHRYESRTAHHCFLGRFELRLWFPINVSAPPVPSSFTCRSRRDIPIRRSLALYHYAKPHVGRCLSPGHPAFHTCRY